MLQRCAETAPRKRVPGVQTHPVILSWERDRGQRNKKAGERLFTRAYSDRTRGNGFKLKGSRFRVDIWKKLLTVRVVRYWNRLSREVVDASSLEVFKTRLDGVLGNLV